MYHLAERSRVRLTTCTYCYRYWSDAENASLLHSRSRAGTFCSRSRSRSRSRPTPHSPSPIPRLHALVSPRETRPGHLFSTVNLVTCSGSDTLDFLPRHLGCDMCMRDWSARGISTRPDRATTSTQSAASERDPDQIVVHQRRARCLGPPDPNKLPHLLVTIVY